MKNENANRDKKKKTKKRTILGSFFTREEPDEDYIPELKLQWGAMDQGQKIKFILGGIIGVILFVAALTLAFLVISSLMP
jgi:hypothetical protein